MSMSGSMPNTEPDTATNWLHVVAAAILDPAGRVLLSHRHAGQHQGERWEFPGGKREPGESREQALARELDEELGIGMTAARPLIQIRHRYPDQAVLLDCWLVEGYTGIPTGREGQQTRWVPIAALPGYRFPAANRPILTALALPDRYLITPEPWPAAAAFLAEFETSLQAGIRLVQLRSKDLARPDLRALAAQTLALTERYGARLLIHGDALLAQEIGAAGVHLREQQLRQLTARPLPTEFVVGASCHDATTLAHAERLGVDFAVLSPVRATASHPAARPLGWQTFHTLVATTTLPVYALGGMSGADRDQAFIHGAQGIAAIRGLWAGSPT